MKSILVVGIFLFTTQIAFAQSIQPIEQNAQKGKFFLYWGWNRGWFSKSDIQFSGADYDFELEKVVAKDRPSAFTLDPYFHPLKFTIPQYNFRLGYFFSPNWNISLGADHMKYIVQADQPVRISGFIADSTTAYRGTYQNDLIALADDFLEFEHTDGLNYINVELRRFDELTNFRKVKINLTEGFGVGGLLPRTNTALLSKDRYDEFHLSGFGLSAMVGINILFYDMFFIQTEFKGGYINMPDIRTTNSISDKASQSFFFAQHNIVFGVVFNGKKKKKR
jgi:hypothetical protein